MAFGQFTDLAAFVQVAEAGGFRAAAHRHGVSASSLSDAVQRLERESGVRLFNRTTRSVVLTEAGQQLRDRLLPALAEMTAAYDGLASDSEITGTLKLDVPGIVARHVLPPIVARFLTAYPRIRIQISVTEGLVDVVAAGCVAGIRYSEHLAVGMIRVPIGPRRQRYAAVASPSYLAAKGTPSHPRELIEHSCIAHLFPDGRINPWEFERGGEKIRIFPRGRLTAAISDVQVAAALAGHGIIYTFEEIVVSSIRQGALVSILSDWSEEFDGPFLYYPQAHRRDLVLAAFVDFIKQMDV